MATTNGGGAANASTAWTVAGPEGEDVASPIFGVNERPTIPLADTLAAARVRSNTARAINSQLCSPLNFCAKKMAN